MELVGVISGRALVATTTYEYGLSSASWTDGYTWLAYRQHFVSAFSLN